MQKYLRLISFLAFLLIFQNSAASEDHSHVNVDTGAYSIDSPRYKDVGLKFVMSHMINQSVQVSGYIDGVNKANLGPDELWADLHVPISDKNRVKPGQTVYIRTAETVPLSNTYRSSVEVILPAQAEKPFVIARVKLSKTNSESQLLPGVKVSGRIVTDAFVVTAAIEKSALQQIEGKQGIFVLKDKTYHFTPLELGREGDMYVEVQSGVQEKSIYVNKNAHLLKEDLDKTRAQHKTNK